MEARVIGAVVGERPPEGGAIERTRAVDVADRDLDVVDAAIVLGAREGREGLAHGRRGSHGTEVSYEAMVGPSAPSRIGATLRGGFRLLDVLAEDARGAVYRGEHHALARSVAIRVVPSALTEGERLERLEAAVRDASRLVHPNVAAILDVGRTEARELFVVSELARGTELAVLRSGGAISPVRASGIARQLLLALGEAHALGLVHGALDARSAWVEPMRPRGELVRLVGLGLATLDEPIHRPEDDVLAVATLLFELATGFAADEARARGLADAHVLAAVRGVPERLAHVITAALAGGALASATRLAEELLDATEPITEVHGASRAPPSLPGGGMLACSACHAIIPALAFCGKCGSRLPIRSLVPQASAPSFPLTLVARDDDLAWLEDRLNDASSALLGARIVGESGSGRTRLLEELAVRAAETGREVVTLAPSAHGVAVPYDAVRRAIVALARIDAVALVEGAFPKANAETRRALVEIVLGVAGDLDDRTPDARRFAAAEALRWALARAGDLARGAPYVLAIDDLDELDWPSRTAIADVVGEGPRVAALIVATHAPGFDAGWPAEHPARPIGGLPADIAALLVPAGKLGVRVRAGTDAGGRGVLPLYVEHLARLAIAGGEGAPPRLGDLLALRIEALDLRARRALVALSVLGRASLRGLIAALLPREDDLDDALAVLAEGGFVVVAGAYVTFSHPRIREIVLAGLPPEPRRELHARALALLDARDVPLEVRAEHAYHAFAMPVALRLAGEVATAAARLGDTGVALTALRRAAELSRRDAQEHPTPESCSVLLDAALRLADLSTATGHFREAEQTLDDLLATTTWGPTDHLLVIERCARLAAARRRPGDAAAFVEIALELAVKASSEPAAARLIALQRDLAKVEIA